MLIFREMCSDCLSVRLSYSENWRSYLCVLEADTVTEAIGLTRGGSVPYASEYIRPRHRCVIGAET